MNNVAKIIFLLLLTVILVFNFEGVVLGLLTINPIFLVLVLILYVLVQISSKLNQGR
ncbi:hypothetical protein DealDRAFT_0774 [Dethiobacter alkaliphilus AHT 1]|uniref:Uncharacterized protein n=1 Tax=Dethiobacter alkaliphilus AHT 1 TaxID=555088 RepID=C0GE65_DETAL|nr:hypothetical protein DealDRAFT_0774 [Dethiobacter alkaliphilus AHT 1]